MGLKGLLLGHEVKVYYDRHLTKTEKAEDAENPSEYEILKGVVNGVYKDMILISYSYLLIVRMFRQPKRDCFQKK